MALTIPVERIQTEAREQRFDVRQPLLAAARALLTVVLAVPYVLAWTVHKICLGVWACLTMLGTAAAVGWRDAGRSRPAKVGAGE